MLVSVLLVPLVIGTLALLMQRVEARLDRTTPRRTAPPVGRTENLTVPPVRALAPAPEPLELSGAADPRWAA